MAVSVGALTLVGVPLDAASIIALGVASSSSVVVVNITRSRRRTTNPETERAMLAWSVVQDIVIVGAAVVLLSFVGLGERGPLLALVLFAAFGVFAAVAGWVMPNFSCRYMRSPTYF